MPLELTHNTNYYDALSVELELTPQEIKTDNFYTHQTDKQSNLEYTNPPVKCMLKVFSRLPDGMHTRRTNPGGSSPTPTLEYTATASMA